MEVVGDEWSTPGDLEEVVRDFISVGICCINHKVIHWIIRFALTSLQPYISKAKPEEPGSIVAEIGVGGGRVALKVGESSCC